MASPLPHEIVLVPAPGQPGREELRQQCYDARIDVFHHEQGFPLDTEIDESVQLRAPSCTLRAQQLTPFLPFLPRATATSGGTTKQPISCSALCRR